MHYHYREIENFNIVANRAPKEGHYSISFSLKARIDCRDVHATFRSETEASVPERNTNIYLRDGYSSLHSPIIVILACSSK